MDARRWSRGRLAPLIAETPVLRKLVPPGRRADGVTLAEKHFPGGALYTGSANIPSDLASLAIERLILDEVDRMPRELEGEGSAVDLAMRRLATFAGRRKVFEISTPTNEVSRIDADFQRSSRGRYFVPCPACGEMQVLRFANLKWPDGKPEQARYACEACGVLIEEHHKTEMLAAGEWRHEKPELCESIIGFHVNGLYTAIGLGDTWAEHAAEWERARGDPAKKRVFVNTRLGETVKTERIVVEWDALYARREPYRLRTVPRGSLVLTAGVDVQGDRLEAQLVSWGRDERATVIDYVKFYGDPTRLDTLADGTPSVWQQLDTYLAAEIANDCGTPMRISCALIDSGFLQHEVLSFVRDKRGRRIFASKGSSVFSCPPIGRPKALDITHRGMTHKRGAEQYQIGVHTLKTTLYARLRADDDALPADRRLRFSDELEAEYFRQLTAEVWDPKHGWVKRYDRNESLDTFILAMAAAMHHSVAVHRMRDLDWQRLEEMYERSGVAQPVETAAVGKVPVQTRSGFFPTAAVVR
jgi:phage terminase large subunit GpA-like protein